ncbi:MAG: S53 family peptidase [Armatimonadetes bacterium]|nr:S53 family peptidase [Armatimonadota bacterium]MDE2206404.1 S53 family peptidase [Armatimonadota bacterium]
MKQKSITGLLIGIGICCLVTAAAAQRGRVFVPASSVEHAGDRGVRAHTNHLLMIGGGNPDLFTGVGGAMSPADLRSVYSLPSTGGSQAIAIVDAYAYGTALKDFNVFAGQYGLPKETSTNVLSSTNKVFQVVYATGKKPSGNGGWDQEQALDIEWAHAMAPSAKIYLVEAASASFTALFNAVNKASSLAGVTEVSMSWSGSEFSTESSDDTYFQHAGIVYFASAGDTGGVNGYPSVSPDVVSAGGTTINVDANKNFSSETAWSGSGGGPSAYEARPSWQNGISTIVGSKRGCPDMSFDANPATGVSVYDSTKSGGLSGWLQFGGTSVSSPSLAGIVNLAGSFYGGSTAELTAIYNTYASASYAGDFRDITSGTAGSFSCTTGWDFITGVGSPLGLGGK